MNALGAFCAILWLCTTAADFSAMYLTSTCRSLKDVRLSALMPDLCVCVCVKR